MQLAFGTGILFAVQTMDANGAAVSNATAVQFGNLQDISCDISFEEKLLYGAYQFPIAVGRGKGKAAFKAKMANINGTIIGDLLLGTGTIAGIKSAVTNYAATVPASTPWQNTVVPPNSGTFVADLGVINSATGLPLKKVASGPLAGQYSVTGAGVYTFASADANAAIAISYEYSATSTTARIATMSNQLMGYAPTFRAALNLSYGGKTITMVFAQCMSSKLSIPFKNDDFAIPEFDFSAFADASNNLGYIATTE